MVKTKIKKWGVKIILSTLLAIFLIANAPMRHTQIATAAPAAPAAATTEPAKATSELEKACMDVFKVECDNLTEEIFNKGKEAAEITGTLAEWKASVSKSQVDEQVAQQAKNSLEFLVGMQKVLNKLLWPILFMTGGLMDNSLLFGSGMEARLREIWIPIRNIVNILFVVILVGIALYNVLGIGDENGTYSIKAILPKLIVGIIVVNFSFLGIKVFLDAINVLTVSIFAIPSQIDEGLGQILASPDGDQSESIKRMCRAMKDSNGGEKVTQEKLQKEDALIIKQVVAQKYQYKYSKSFEGNKITASDSASKIDEKVEAALAWNLGAITQYEEDQKYKEDGKFCDGELLTPLGIAYLNRWDSRNASLAMVLNMGKIVFYEDVDLTANKVDKLVINSVFSVMMWLIYAASFIALFIVLLARLVVMWLAIALSPVLLLMIAVPAIKEQISGFGEISGQFVKNAIAPLGIALSMTVGWVMLRALQSVNNIGGENSRYLDFSNGFPVVGLSTIQDLIVALGTVAVVWLGVFSAASSSIAAPVTDWMKGGLQKAGSWIGTLPLKHAPLFPIEIAGQKKEFTGEQILTAMSDLGNSSAKRNALSDLIRGETNTKPSVLNEREKITTAADVASVINRNKSAFYGGDESALKELSRMRRDNSKAWEDLNKNTDGQKIIAAVDVYEKDPTPVNAKTQGKIIAENARRITEEEYEGDRVKTAATPAKPSTEVTGLDKTTKFGEHTLTEHGGNDEAGERIAKNMIETFGKIREGLIDGKLTTVAQVARAINESEVRPTNEAELELLLKGDAYTKLKGVLTTANIAPQKFVNDNIENNLLEQPAPPAPPAGGPAAPTTGSTAPPAPSP